MHRYSQELKSIPNDTFLSKNQTFWLISDGPSCPKQNADIKISQNSFDRESEAHEADQVQQIGNSELRLEKCVKQWLFCKGSQDHEDMVLSLADTRIKCDLFEPMIDLDDLGIDVGLVRAFLLGVINSY